MESILQDGEGKNSQAADLFMALMRSSPIGIYIVQDGRFVAIGQQFADFVGYTREELLGTESLNYVYEEDLNMVRANAIQALKTGSVKPYAYRVKTKSGEIKWVLETIISIQHQGKQAAMGNFMDITERRQAREEMRLANEKLSALVERFETQNRLNNMLSEMRDLLQSCSNVKETGLIVSSSVKKIFPSTQGALYLMSESRSDLESVARWGDFPEDVDDNVFAPADCWGLRRGRAHIVTNAADDPVCPHVRQVPPGGYMCLPLTARGNVIGLLHLKTAGATPAENTQSLSSIKDIAINLSEQLSLAISNVKLTESLSRQSIQDPLSGLFNRRYMEESLLREIARAKRKQAQVGIVMADLDHFKQFNDTYGHAAGDMLISQVGRVFKQGIRASDIACRFGGEEFVLILIESSLEDTQRRADEIREAVKKIEIVFQGQFLSSVTVSMGIATYPQNASAIDDLLRIADTALYKAKQTGRDKVVIAGI
jgi:diguanylate cyclase (GGDEF)-like protein/PAS domain S-box-containing protein